MGLAASGGMSGEAAGGVQVLEADDGAGGADRGEHPRRHRDRLGRVVTAVLVAD
jgi:hypothetical protein